MLDDPRDGVVGRVVAEQIAHQPGGRLPLQRRQAHLVEVPALPQVGEALADLGAGQAQHHEAPPGQVAQRGVDQLHAGSIAPVDVLHHQEERVRLALGGQPLEPGRPHVVEAQHAIPLGRAQRREEVDRRTGPRPARR